MYSINDFRLYHSSKGSTWKEHKYTTRTVVDGKVSYSYGPAGSSSTHSLTNTNQQVDVNQQINLAEKMTNVDAERCRILYETQIKVIENRAMTEVNTDVDLDKMFEEWDENTRN